jgi:putative glutamine amidotransferase
MRALVLGYSPFDSPTISIYPFDSIFDYGRNLIRESSLSGCDAVVLWGGADIPPAFYSMPPIQWNTGPTIPTQRDLFEWEILREATQRGIPIIGVCRGAQLICAFAGGKLAQHISGHSLNHEIVTSTGETFSVSSSHHQMMVPEGASSYELLAWPCKNLSTVYDGLPEAERLSYTKGVEREAEVVYFKDLNAMAIQCHPEWHKEHDPFNKWLMQTIIDKQFNGVTCV